MKIEGILARTASGVIGKGDLIPWHHSGDMKRFKRITDGHAIMFGVKTFLGIAKHHSSDNRVLPGRDIFVVSSKDHGWLDAAGVDTTNVSIVYDGDPIEVFMTIEDLLGPCKTLFVAGGAKVYKKYLEFSSSIHETVIDVDVPESSDLVKLDQQTLSFLNSSRFRDIVDVSSEESRGLWASYRTLVR